MRRRAIELTAISTSSIYTALRLLSQQEDDRFLNPLSSSFLIRDPQTSLRKSRRQVVVTNPRRKPKRSTYLSFPLNRSVHVSGKRKEI